MLDAECQICPEAFHHADVKEGFDAMSEHADTEHGGSCSFDVDVRPGDGWDGPPEAPLEVKPRE